MGAPRVTVDPFVLAVPSVGDSSRRAVEAYIDDLLLWRSLQSEKWLGVDLSERAVECLVQDECYPVYPLVRRAFEAYGIEYVAVRDVTALVNVILSRAVHLEARYGIGEVLAEPLGVYPHLGGVRRFQHIAEDLTRCLSIVALVTRELPEVMSNHRVATRESGCTDRLIRVEGTVHAAEEREGSPLLGRVAYPVELNERIRICETFSEVLDSLDPVDVWKAGGVEEHISLAIRLAVFVGAREKGLVVDWEDTGSFGLGREFIGSAMGNGFMHDEARIRRVLRACRETILGENLRHVHQLREGRGPGEAQVARGRDRAWRRDIDHEFHLHFWERSEQGPEFAAVVTHNDFGIPF